MDSSDLGATLWRGAVDYSGHPWPEVSIEVSIGEAMIDGTTQPNLTASIVPVIVGGVLALTGSLGATYLAAAVARRQRKRSIAGALAGEIGALVDIAETRKYIDAYDALIAQTESTGETMALGVVARYEYFSIFNAYAASLGELPPDLARDVARFYVITKSILEDGADAAEGNVKSDQALARLRNTRALLVTGLALGKDLILRLTAVAEGK